MNRARHRIASADQCAVNAYGNHKGRGSWHTVVEMRMVGRTGEPVVGLTEGGTVAKMEGLTVGKIQSYVCFFVVFFCW